MRALTNVGKQRALPRSHSDSQANKAIVSQGTWSCCIVGNAVMMLGAQRAVLVPFRFPVFCEFAEGVIPYCAGTGPHPNVNIRRS